MDSPTRRSGIVLIENDRVALIERKREGQTYYLFPGGMQEPNETLEATAVREAYEELGLHVRIERLVAVVDSQKREQYYYVATRTGGSFGTGSGDEFDPAIDPHKGTYHPVWLELASLAKYDVRPQSLASLLVDPGLREIEGAVALND